jgi:hypothetical protein
MRKILQCVAFLSTMAFPLVRPPAEGTGDMGVGKGDEGVKELAGAREDFGWRAFEDWKQIRKFILAIAGAAVLGAVIARHPFRSPGAAR